MAERLLDKVDKLDADNKINDVFIEKSTSKKKTAVKRITNEETGKDKQISAKVNGKVYKQFTQINDAQGLSNNSALNMIISKYVRENKGLLEED